MLFAGAAPVSALGMSVGVNTWYTTFDISPSGGEDVDPGFLYGPVIGLDWGKNWSLTSVLLTGNFKHHSPDTSVPVFNERRYDSDTTLNYSINKWLKVFGGFKYSRFDAHESLNADEYGRLLMPFEQGNSRFISYGPGAGIGISLPLADSLFVVGNFSLLYLVGKETEPAGMGLENKRFTDTGFNTTVQLAYYLDSYSTTLLAGVRYQYFKEEYSNSEAKFAFLGVTVSAIYHFSLGGEE
ncbi:MAG: hypothetical protein EPN93_00820 [Spirochaetes bacterium]|nr:MAG: hypothetical protein EPN93_00820 [Spirochaetota bacterium]